MKQRFFLKKVSVQSVSTDKTPQTDRRHRHERKKQLDRTKLELEGAEAKLVAAVMRMMTVMLIGGGGGAGGAGPQPPPLITATGLN